MNQNSPETLEDSASMQSKTSEKTRSCSVPDEGLLTETEGESMLQEFLADGDWALGQFKKNV